MNEFVENNHVNSAINHVYQAMFSMMDRGRRNGEIKVNIDCPANVDLNEFADEITAYFNNQYHAPLREVRKYFTEIQISDSSLVVDIKWGYHAIIANANATA